MRDDWIGLVGEAAHRMLRGKERKRLKVGEEWDDDDDDDDGRVGRKRTLDQRAGKCTAWSRLSPTWSVTGSVIGSCTSMYNLNTDHHRENSLMRPSSR